MNEAQLLRRLTDADAYPQASPLPEEIWTADLALREIERRIGMSQEKTEISNGRTETRRRPPAPVPTRRGSATIGRGLWIGIAAAAVVVVAGALFLFRGEEGLIAGQPPGPLDAYVAALQANDSEGALAVLESDVLEGFTPFLIGADTSGITVTDCEVRNAASNLVVCQVDMGPDFFFSQIGSDRMTTLIARIGESSMELVDIPNPDPTNAPDRQFAAWLKESYPDRYGEMFDETAGTLEKNVWSEEAGRVRFEFLDEYLAYLAAQG